MELATLNDGEAVTTSLAIANGTGTQHKNVMELTKKYLVDLHDFGGVAFQTRSFSTRGGIQQREIALLNEQQATLLLTYMRNSDIVRAFKKRLVKAFYELAQNQRSNVVDFHSLIANPEHLRQALLQYTEKVIELENKVAEQAPKAEFHDTVAQAINSQTIQEVAKVLSVGPNKLFKALREQGYIMSNNLPYENYIDAGYFKVTEGTYKDKRGEIHNYTRTLVTGKGLTYLHKKLVLDFRAQA